MTPCRLLVDHERAEFAAQARISVPELALQLGFAAENAQELVLHGDAVRNVLTPESALSTSYFFNVVIGPHEELAIGGTVTAPLHCQYGYL